MGLVYLPTWMVESYGFHVGNHLYTTYILPSGGLYAAYHLLREPETTIKTVNFHKLKIRLKDSSRSCQERLQRSSDLRLLVGTTILKGGGGGDRKLSKKSPTGPPFYGA